MGELVARLLVGTLVGLRRKEEALPAVAHPLADAALGAAIPGGGVDVVDAQEGRSSVGCVSSGVEARPRAAAPKMTRVLWWPVLPKG
jgi:hypothetical protein